MLDCPSIYVLTCPSIMGGCGSLAVGVESLLSRGVLLRSWYSETDD